MQGAKRKIEPDWRMNTGSLFLKPFYTLTGRMIENGDHAPGYTATFQNKALLSCMCTIQKTKPTGSVKRNGSE